MKLETDPKVAERLAEEREEENWVFRTVLKRSRLRVEELDAIVHRLYEEVARQIDCRACCNCCRMMVPVPSEADVARLADGLGITSKEVNAQYLASNEEGELIFKRLPCPFLGANGCRVYMHRPELCRSFPNLHKTEFVHRLIQVVNNCRVCPIVFNVYERLKAELRY